MKFKYFREYFCSFSSKSYYFYILGVSHLNGGLWLHNYDGACEIDRCVRKRYQASIYLYKVTDILFVQGDMTPLTTAFECIDNKLP